MHKIIQPTNTGSGGDFRSDSPISPFALKASFPVQWPVGVREQDSLRDHGEGQGVLEVGYMEYW